MTAAPRAEGAEPAAPAGKTHAKLWGAFVLSGLGR
jgi:hypothetical protein